MITLRIKHLFASLMLATTSACAAQQEQHSAPAPNNLENVVESALQAFYTPGMAVGVIKDGEVVYLDGVGQRQLDPALPVNADTYFRLASTSKAFTAAALAMAIDDFNLSWDTRVTDILPDFQMQDAWVTREFTLMDLLVHRSGLASGAGDSMLWPEPSGFTREEIIHNLRYLTPASSFRSTYAYSNLMYITAGEVVATLYEKPFSQIIEEKIFSPLEMPCFAGDQTDAALSNAALSYGHNDERGIYAIPRNGILGTELVSAAAGGIVCNASGMLKWLQMWLNEGVGANGAQILTPQQITTIQKPRTVLSVSNTDDEWDDTLFKAYGLGWRLADVHGYRVISHTGTLSGYQAYVAMVPEIDLAVVLLNNGSNYGARSAVMQHILKAYITPQDTTNWVQTLQDYQAEREQRYLANLDVPEGIGEVILDPVAYSGEFTDTWYGTMQITLNQAGQLRLGSDKMTMLTGTLEPFSDHTFVIRWDNQNAASDAFVHFEVNPAREVTGFTFYPFTHKEKQSHNFSDTHFIKSDL